MHHATRNYYYIVIHHYYYTVRNQALQPGVDSVHDLIGCLQGYMLEKSCDSFTLSLPLSVAQIFLQLCTKTHKNRRSH